MASSVFLNDVETSRVSHFRHQHHQHAHHVAHFLKFILENFRHRWAPASPVQPETKKGKRAESPAYFPVEPEKTGAF